MGKDALTAVRDGGTYVGAVPGMEPPSELGIHVDHRYVKADGTLLAELAHLADQGVLQVRVAGPHPLDQAATAHARMAEGGLR
ncbi:zinc-binding dehydrogenase [Streptomyces sp. TLI_105]|uniref:zinc-binding dehydrogenase n=1 Tax=Streptomyces sp. TLI_105 TaxID=1881019 RepID=UPI00115FC51E